MNAQELFDTYFENIRFIYNLFFSNSKFTLKLYGDAFSSFSPLHSWESDCKLACNFPSCHALFVHSCSIVVEDESLPPVAEEDCVLKFVCKNVGSVLSCDLAVCLSPTSDTCNLLEADSCGLSCKVLVTDDSSAEEYFFLEDAHAGSFPQRLLFCYCPVIPVKLTESETSAIVYDWAAVQTTLAIASESWPITARSWVTQSHPWISHEVVNTVASSTVYFVPKLISQCCVTTMSQKPVLWKSEFIAAEDMLMKYLSAEMKVAYQLLLQLVNMHHLACCCVSNELLIKYALFWCLDRMPMGESMDNKSVVAYYMCTLKTLHLFLCKRHFPHYFMLDVNILCNCDSSVGDISWMEVPVTNSTAVQLKADEIQQILTSTSSDITNGIVCHLKALFGYSISMSYIQLFQHLHADTSIDYLITQHLDMLNHIHSRSLVSRQLFVKPLITWLSSSLGTMYLVKAHAASPSQCSTEYVQKAEHCMLQAVAGNDMLSCTLYLIHFLLLMKYYKEAIFYMDTILANVDFTQFSAIQSQNFIDNCISGTLSFSDQLLAMWSHTSRHVNVMFSPHELSLLFPQLKSSLLYACCNEIGYSKSPVVILKVEFWIQYIGALCYMHSDVTKALNLLADAERRLVNSMLPTVGVSDRAHIAYFNTLAGTSIFSDI